MMRDEPRPSERGGSAADLFGVVPLERRQPLAEGAVLLRGFAQAHAPALMAAVGGYRMSVAMTNCGEAGWITDRRGYRYARLDPLTERAWPAMPAPFQDLARCAAAAAGYDGFVPDACLINRYEPGTQLSLHQDKDERDYAAPIVSVSLGLSAVFLFGGLRRSDRPRRILVTSGDVAVWGGPSRLVYHGVAPLAAGDHPLTGRSRINLTLRRAL
jgi:DNA oxidative demethylase